MKENPKDTAQALMPPGYILYKLHARTFDYADPETGILEPYPSGLVETESGGAAVCYKEKPRYISIAILGILDNTEEH